MHPRLNEALITLIAESSWNSTHAKWDQWDTAPLSEKRRHAEDTEEKLPTGLGSVIQDAMDSDGDFYRYLMLIAEDQWAGLSDDGAFYDNIGGGYIVSWSPSEGKETEPEMDEDDHEDDE